jgi:uncharacterized protein (DUF2336 family)
MTTDMQTSAGAAAADGPGRAAGYERRAIFRRLLDVVALPASRTNSQDRAIAGDILMDMLLEADISSRELAARRLASMSQAPKRILRFLAIDAPHVAALVLGENGGFDDSDLLYVISKGAPPHYLAVANRRDVSPAVATALAATSDYAAIRRLLENAQARLSDAAVDMIVSMSRLKSDLIGLLIQREEIQPAQALAMFWWAGPQDRRTILMRFAAERVLLIDGCSDLFRTAAEERWSDPSVLKALRLIERRQRDRVAMQASSFESLEALVAHAADIGLTTDIMDEISRMAGLRGETGERIFMDPGAEGLAVLCKAVGLRRAYLELLWRSLRRTGPAADAIFQRVSEIYETIAVARAQTVLRYWNWSILGGVSETDVERADGEAPDRRRRARS